ncbi:MAG: hypothetical protein ACP5F3_05675, partial [Candidatus Syntrophosphaera sp.]
PYPEAPAGADIIPPDVVDWVALELLAAPGNPPVRSQSVWLGADGYLRSPGISFVAFPDAAPGPYHIRIRHRNHVSILSSGAITLTSSGEPVLCDLSLPANVYDPAGTADLGNGFCAMMAGDANQDGQVNAADRDFGWRAQAGAKGYLSADFSLDANVFPDDLNHLWRPNSGIILDPRDNARGGITCHLGNPLLQTEGDDVYFSLDVMVSADLAGERMGTGIILLEYNPDVFGNSLINANGLTVSAGELLADGYLDSFNILCKDHQEDILAITFEYTGSGTEGPLLTAYPVCLLELSFRINELSGISGVDFCEDLMQGQQFMADNSTLFDPVGFDNLEYDYLPSPPQDLEIICQDGTINLSWAPVPGCQYNVYSSADPMTGAWTLEAGGLQDPAWTDISQQGMRFYKVASTKVRHGS